MFIGFARGLAPWRSPATGRIEKGPLYRDLAFHRVIDGVLVQTGCPRGDGTGQPGYRVPIERSRREREYLATAGALVMASYHAAPNRPDPDPPPPGAVIGSQFGITVMAMPHLLGAVTVIGRCRDLEVVGEIAGTTGLGRSRLQAVRISAAQ